MNALKEWFIDAPWGKIAMASWGTPKGVPVLLVHGRQDSLATFIPMLNRFPSHSYHYVGLDLPGHGKSDPFPCSVMLTRSHFVAPVDIVVKAMGWKHFIYLGHSMGAEIGLLYNAIRPGKVLKLVLLDAGVALQKHAPVTVTSLYSMYARYYQNYDEINKGFRVHTMESALESVQAARDLSPKMAELVLSRSLIPYKEKIVPKAPSLDDLGFEKEQEEETVVDTTEKFTLAWDQRLKNLAPTNFTFDQWVYICTHSLPQTLFIAVAESVPSYEHSFAGKLVNEMRRVSDCKYIELHGTHDIHLTSTDDVAEEITMFLNIDICVSKL